MFSIFISGNPHTNSPIFTGLFYRLPFPPVPVFSFCQFRICPDEICLCLRVSVPVMRTVSIKAASMFHTPSQQQDASADKKGSTIHHDHEVAGYAGDIPSPQIPFPCTLYSWKCGSLKCSCRASRYFSKFPIPLPFFFYPVLLTGYL